MSMLLALFRGGHDRSTAVLDARVAGALIVSHDRVNLWRPRPAKSNGIRANSWGDCWGSGSPQTGNPYDFKSLGRRSAEVAVSVGFEPTLEFPLNTLSKRAPSTTRPTHHHRRLSGWRSEGGPRGPPRERRANIRIEGVATSDVARGRWNSVMKRRIPAVSRSASRPDVSGRGSSMTPDAFDAACRALPAVTMDVQWGADHVYKVGGKMFAVIGPAEHGVSRKVSDIAYGSARLKSGVARPGRPTSLPGPNGSASTASPTRTTPKCPAGWPTPTPSWRPG